MYGLVFAPYAERVLGFRQYNTLLTERILIIRSDYEACCGILKIQGGLCIYIDHVLDPTVGHRLSLKKTNMLQIARSLTSKVLWYKAYFGSRTNFVRHWNDNVSIVFDVRSKWPDRCAEVGLRFRQIANQNCASECVLRISTMHTFINNVELLSG